MTIRAKRRTVEGTPLEKMTTDDLEAIWFFGDLVNNGTVTFRATPEDQRRAAAILEERGAQGARTTSNGSRDE